MNSLRPLLSSCSTSTSSRFVLLGSNGARSTIGGGVRSSGIIIIINNDDDNRGGRCVGASSRRERRTTDERRETPAGHSAPGHGERLYVHNHMVANFTSNKAFRQFAYTGKKLVPAKLRKDYWRPLAVVEFAPGKGEIGRSVFQKLRELKQRHLLEWEDAALLDMSRRERGKALNDQRGNTVADLAAVLAGRGKGNRVAVPRQEEDAGKPRVRISKNGKWAQVLPPKVKEVDREGWVEVPVSKDAAAAAAGAEEGGEKIRLHRATVYWANEQDKYFAEEWTENVKHVIGLPAKALKGEAVADAAAAEPVEAEAATA
ncbi:hypothetical protein NEMBOFW57_000963 [Staphylotrichum longicolle]|uniref:Large ribosomal subunit protein mL67 n=1 Tax=Staphylotrichum longicolle TaxID=669026 RepID=A0AAD4I0E0_9PEZI|nr:hypothetical protein NEMBOFW57_000963 [Staphylotrichum longicolle]